MKREAKLKMLSRAIIAIDDAVDQLQGLIEQANPKQEAEECFEDAVATLQEVSSELSNLDWLAY